MNDSTGHESESLTHQLLDQQAAGWEAGHCLRVEELLADCHEANDDPSLITLLLRGEMMLRVEAGEGIELVQEMRGRFPHFSDEIFNWFLNISSVFEFSSQPGSSGSTPTIRGEFVPIPDYRLLKRIGAGGFGQVYIGENPKTQMRRAVKVLGKLAAIEIEGIKARIRCAENHPHLLPISHVGSYGPNSELTYCVMPLADSLYPPNVAPVSTDEWLTCYVPRTLAVEIDRHRSSVTSLPVASPKSGRALAEPTRPGFPVDEVITLMHGMLSALQELHSQKIVHSDVKPDNILSIEGVWKLGDMGLAREASSDSSVKGPRGTRRYWPPEGPQGKLTDDLFALGRTGWEVWGEVSVAVSDRGSQPVRSWRQADSHRGRQLRVVLERACAPDQTQRFQSAAQMKAALPPLRTTRYRTQSFVAAGLIALMFMLMILPYSQRDPQRETELNAPLDTAHSDLRSLEDKIRLKKERAEIMEQLALVEISMEDQQKVREIRQLFVRVEREENERFRKNQELQNLDKNFEPEKKSGLEDHVKSLWLNTIPESHLPNKQNDSTELDFERANTIWLKSVMDACQVVRKEAPLMLALQKAKVAQARLNLASALDYAKKTQLVTGMRQNEWDQELRNEIHEASQEAGQALAELTGILGPTTQSRIFCWVRFLDLKAQIMDGHQLDEAKTKVEAWLQESPGMVDKALCETLRFRLTLAQGKTLSRGEKTRIMEIIKTTIENSTPEEGKGLMCIEQSELNDALMAPFQQE